MVSFLLFIRLETEVEWEIVEVRDWVLGFLHRLEVEGDLHPECGLWLSLIVCGCRALGSNNKESGGGCCWFSHWFSKERGRPRAARLGNARYGFEPNIVSARGKKRCRAAQSLMSVLPPF